MKKITLYIALIAVTGSVLTACGGRDWDTDDELEYLTVNWSHYVSDVLDYVFENIDSTKNNDGRLVTLIASVNDTLNLTFHWLANSVGGDSVNVRSTLIQIGDSSAVTVDGNRYSENLWAHLYTVEPGIINFDGKFRIDFYEVGKTTPWAWSEITYEKDTIESHYRPYVSNPTQVGRY